MFVGSAEPKKSLLVYVQEKKEEDLMPKAQKFLYGNGTSNPPTAVELDKALVRDLFFTLSPAKVLSTLYS